MFFSERLECSSFDKLLENVSENSRKKFAQFLEFARITSFVWNNPHSFPPDIRNAVLTTLQKLVGESLKIFYAKFGKQWMKDFLQDKFPDIFSSGGLECSLTSLLRISCQKSEKFFHFLNLFICLFTISLTYDLTDHENFLSKS